MSRGTSASTTDTSSSDPVDVIIDAEGIRIVTFSAVLRTFSWAYGFEVWYK